MLPLEHSAILLFGINLKSTFLECPFYTGFTVYISKSLVLIIDSEPLNSLRSFSKFSIASLVCIGKLLISGARSFVSVRVIKDYGLTVAD